MVWEQNVRRFTTYLTKIHHRESAMRILYGVAAPLWLSEVVYQQSLGYPVEGVYIPDDMISGQHIKSVSYATHHTKSCTGLYGFYDFRRSKGYLSAIWF